MDNAVLGKYIKSLYKKISEASEASEDKEISLALATSLLLIDIVHAQNKVKSEFNFDEVTIKDEQLGDWLVTVEQIKEGN